MTGFSDRSALRAAWLRPAGARPFVLGHRGARHAAPENTLAAFELARREGADGVELDVRLDGDERVVVLHDRTLERVSNQRETRDVEALGGAELARVPIGEDRVPLLAEVLSWARETTMRVNVELKHDVSRPLALLRGVRRVVQDSGLGAELLLFSSFQPAFVVALRALVPGVPGAWLVDRDDRWFRGAPAFRLVADGVNPHRELVQVRALSRWKRHGAPIATWTVNEPDEARRVAALGVDTIISDKPGEILRALAST